MTEAIEYDGARRDRGVEAARGQLGSVLVAGERVSALALQHRLYALVNRRHLAAATTGRFIFFKRRLLGGFDPVTVRWQDLKAVRISTGAFTASVTIAYSANLSDTAEDGGDFQEIRASGLGKAQGAALYRECQGQEQAWREKRRIRTMEEMRARSGGTQIATGIYPQGSLADRPLEIAAGSAPSPGEGPAARLAQAKAMLAEGLITDSEYEGIKAKIIGGL